MQKGKIALSNRALATILTLALFSLLGIALCSCESGKPRNTNIQTVTLTTPDSNAEEDPEAADAETATSDEETDSDSSESAEIESSTTVESEAEQSDQQEQASGGSTIINLDDPAQYQQVNLFLSNFSEVYMLENPFETQTASDEALCGFALWHTYRNSPDLVEHDSSGQGYYHDGLYRYNIRITQDRANELSQRYFGRSINFDNVTSMDEPFYCADGYVYNETTNGAGLPAGITLAKNAVDQGDGTVRIDFDIYFNATPYDSTDTSLYGMSPEDLMAYMGCEGPSRTGSAVVYYGDYNDYTGGLLLASWQADAV